MKTLTGIVIGAGNRGMRYTDIMRESGDKFRIVGVAEPVEARREYIRTRQGVPEDRCFTDYHPLLALGKIADFAIISTIDPMHYEPARMAIELGYDLLLEKPVSPEPEQCLELARLAKEKGVKVLVCHVMRYANLFVKVKELLDAGAVGQIISVNHEENVGHVHQAHSFVRGNWANTNRASSMLMQKSCHDIDMIQWLLGKKCLKVQSFGRLSHFTADNAPAGSPEYCIDGCPAADTCPYNAVKLYLDDKDNRWFRCCATKIPVPDDAQVEAALHTTQFGKCVYKCDNNVVDHQTVNMLFEDDVTVTFTMSAFNKGGRTLHVMGTKGELHADQEEDGPIRLFDLQTGETSLIDYHTIGAGIESGHGGGDEGIVDSFYDYLTGAIDGTGLTELGISVDNHLIVFAAEESRRNGTVVDLDEYIRSLG